MRLFAFVRFTTGDAMSKRSKFALITWIGENVSGLQRAKTGTDKTLVKEVVQVLGLVFFLGWGGRGWRPGQNASCTHLWTPRAAEETFPELFAGCGLGAGSQVCDCDHHIMERWQLRAYLWDGAGGS